MYSSQLNKKRQQLDVLIENKVSFAADNSELVFMILIKVRKKWRCIQTNYYFVPCSVAKKLCMLRIVSIIKRFTTRIVCISARARGAD